MVLQFSDVKITYATGFCAVRGVSFALGKGECLAIVGESGCGKTTLVRAALGVLPKNTKISGSIKIGEIEITNASEKTLQKLRGLMVGFVAQEPFSAFNPLASVFDHVAEAFRVHGLRPKAEKVFHSLENFGIENAEKKARKYPFEWSGGMLQRAVIAASSAYQPEIIIADEPTSALDTDLANAILTTLKKTNAALLLISHDLELVAKYADKIAVLCGGEIVEIGETKEIIGNPQQEYTKKLLASVSPKENVEKVQANSKIILEARNLSKIYGSGENEICAVADANLIVKMGEILGIYGTSGSGKSTLLRMLMAIEKPSGGEVFYENESAIGEKTRKGFVIPIFQEPLGSLNRNWKIWRIVTEPLEAKHLKNKLSTAEKRDLAKKMLAQVGLSEIDLDTKPKRLSVGQCQRVSIARALTAHPKLIIADEPTSALDATSAQTVMRLLREIAVRGTAIVVVSHNENLLKSFCHRVLRMRDGMLESNVETTDEHGF